MLKFEFYLLKFGEQNIKLSKGSVKNGNRNRKSKRIYNRS